MAADEGFKDAVTAEGDEGAVVRVGLVVFGVVRAEAVVKIGGVVLYILLVARTVKVAVGVTAYLRTYPLALVRTYHLP